MDKTEPGAQQERNCPFNPVGSGVPPSLSGTKEERVCQAKQQPDSEQSMYLKELVLKGDTEFSFEEIRAQRYYKQLNEKVLHLSKVKAELKFQIEQKQKLVKGRSNAVEHQQLEAPQHSGQKVSFAPPVSTDKAQLKNCEPETSTNCFMRNGAVNQDEIMGQARTILEQRSLQASNPFTVCDENALPERPNTRSSSKSSKSLKLPTFVLKARNPASELSSDKDASISRSEEAIVDGHRNKTLCRNPDDTCDFVRAATLASTPFGGPVRQNPSERGLIEEQEISNKTGSGTFRDPKSEATAETKKLSPIQETSHEWGFNSYASKSILEPESRRANSGGMEVCQPMSERTESASALETEAVNPCSLDVRKLLLDNVDLSSFANFRRVVGPLPEPNDDLHIGIILNTTPDKKYGITTPGECSSRACRRCILVIKCKITSAMTNCYVTLDGETLFYLKKMGDQETNLYLYHSNGGNVLVKVELSPVPWDFYITSQLNSRLSSDLQHCHAQSSCYFYENGSFTLWRVPPGQTIQLLEERMDRRDVPLLAIRLMEMVKQMHTCGLVHGALRPETLMLCYSCEDDVMGIDFSSSLDLRLQTEVKTVQDLLSAQDYIKQGLLLPSDSPYQLDLCGIAEIVHLLLFEKSMKPVKEGSSWRLAADSGLNLNEPLGSLWEDFFHNLLNPEDKSTEVILSNLINNLKNALYEGLECPFSL